MPENHKIEFVTSVCNCSALRAAARRVTNYYDEFLRPSGLGTAQYGLLTLIRDSGGLAINEIAANTGLDRTTAGKNIRPLEAAGLVEVSKSRADGRRSTVTVTKKGMAAIRVAAPLWRSAQRRFEQSNGAGSAEMLRTALRGLKLERSLQSSDC